MAYFDKDTKIWHGMKLPYPFDANTHLGEEIIKQLDATPDRVIQINHDEQVNYTCKQLKTLSVRIAMNLMKMNFKSDDDVVGLLCRNSSHLLPAIYGSIIAGAPINPVIFAKDEIVTIFHKTKPKIVFCDYDLYHVTKEALNELKSDAKIFTMVKKVPGVGFIGELMEEIADEDKFMPRKFEKSVFEKFGAIMCSSGTTGSIKGCAIPEAFALAMTYDKGLPFSYKSLSFTPSYWGTCILGMVLAPFHPNETLVSTMQPFNLNLLYDLIEKYQINVVFMAGTQLYQFVNSPLTKSKNLASVKAVTSTGSIVTEHVREKFREVMPGRFLNIFYGMTEAFVSIMTPGQSFEGTCVGKIFPNVQVKIVDSDGKAQKTGNIGEVYVKSETYFLGYFKHHEARDTYIDNDGFFKTGDIGFVDENANVHLLERKKNILKCSGYHVSWH
jgi:4-coumarate--CoA ligase